MSIKVLIVDKAIEPAMNIISRLGEADVSVSVVSKVPQAINNLKTHSYHLIIMGDKLTGGDTYDVALGIGRSDKNRKVPVICVGAQVSRSVKLMNLLSPRSMRVDTADVKAIESCVSQIREKFAALVSK